MCRDPVNLPVADRFHDRTRNEGPDRGSVADEGWGAAFDEGHDPFFAVGGGGD
jgi:hypothetical protein